MKSLRGCAGLVFAVFAVATTARASEPIVGRLETALSKPVKVIAGGALFVCEESRCVAQAPTNQTMSVSACRQLAKRVGAIAEFGNSRRTLPPEKLALCIPTR